VAEVLAPAKEIKIICTGGTLRPSSLTLVGNAAELSTSNYFADKGFYLL